MTLSSDTVRSDTVRRGIVETGTTGVTGYQYRAPAKVIGLEQRDDGTPVIAGYAVVWNRFSANLGGYVEQFTPNAFAESLRNDDQIASWNHDYGQVLGRRSADTLTLTSNDIGLRYEIPVDAADPDHVRAARKIERRNVRGSSFTFRWLPDGESWDYTPDGILCCTVTRAQLLEVAPVVWPAYPATELDEFSVGLRSLATQVGRPIEDLIAAVRAGRLTDELGGRPGSAADGATADAARALVTANQRWVELRA